MAREHSVKLTGAQLRVLRDVLTVIANDPDWSEFTGDRDWATFGRAVERITDAHVAACRAESTPAGRLT